MTQTLEPTEIELSGLQLIEASAGTGKTYTIEQLYIRLLVERELEVENILVVTFTNAATSELRDRIRLKLLQARKIFSEEKCSEEDGEGFYTTLLGRVSPEDAGERITRALRSFDLAAIHTIHGFCARILAENAFESGAVFESEIDTDIKPLIEEVVNDFWVKRVYGGDELFVGYLGSMGIGPETLAELAEKIHSRVEAEILPAEAPPTPELPDQANWKRAYDDCREIWAEAGEIILGELQRAAEEKVLNKGTYKPEKIPEWCAELDSYFGLEDPLPISLPEKFENFTRSKLAGKVNKDQSCPEHPFFEACERLHDETTALHEILDASILALKIELSEIIRRDLPRLMKERNLRSYDDILRDLDSALNSDRGLRLTKAICESYKAALIDEFQDTDRVQYRIFRKIHEEGGLPTLFIGDPKQAIYSFRGADIFTYLEAKKDAGDHLHTLDTNWRSDPLLVKAVNTIFSGSENPFKLEQISYKKVSPAEEQKNDLVIDSHTASGLEIIWFDQEYELKSGAARISNSHADDKIGRHLCNSFSSLLDGSCLIKDKPVRPRDIAVLVRNGKQGQKVQQALQEVNIPSVVNGGGNIFKAPELYELHLWLTAVTDPSKEGRLRAALSTSLLGLSAVEVAKLEKDESARDHWINKFHHWNELWNSNGFISVFRDFMESRELDDNNTDPVQKRILSRPDGERCLTNLLHAAELIHAESIARKLSPSQLVDWVESRITSKGIAPDSEELRMESDAEAVQIVTIHSSKGLEYPIVFCPYISRGEYLRPRDKKALVYHDKDEDNKLKLNISPDSNSAEEAQVLEELLQEDLRLFYVALTRARNHCAISWGALSKFSNSSPHWLLAPASEENSALRAAAENLCDRSEGSIRLQDANDSDPVVRPREETGGELACRKFTRRLSHSWRTSSYSGLTRKKHYVHPHLPMGPDHDDGDAEPVVQGTHEAVLAESILLKGFGGGVTAGNCFHEIYEHLDFTESDPAHLEELARERLDKYELETGTWLDKVCETIRETLRTPLDPSVDKLELSAIDRKRRLDELKFLFPLSQGPGGESSGKALDPLRLADVFASTESEGVPQDYADKISTLDFSRLRGFLTGSIDLTFECNGRWYIADYKSNSLGDRLGDYGKDRITETMMSHHYVLQYHIYTIALHRYLQTRLPDYDYEKHFGGVYYLFIKGMKKELGSANGIFRDRPSLKLINKLDETFRGGLS